MKIRSHKELEVYQIVYDAAMQIFRISKSFPKEERYSLTDQIRRSSRSVCANIAEAFRKRRYPNSFVAKLSDAEAETAETQVWLDFAFDCEYISGEMHDDLFTKYENITEKLVNMSLHPDQWQYG